ncbi:MAG: bacillithiol system redox-active protein YtxJ [Blastocatellia bacterium]
MAIFKKLSSPEEVERAIAASYERPIAIFKHSNSCGISADVLEMIESIDAEIYLIVVQEARPASDLVAQQTGIRHHSPQVVVLKSGEPVYYASHYGIDTHKLERHVKE